jgi:hypothetical protein
MAKRRVKRTKLRKRFYLTILLVALILGVLIPLMIKKFSEVKEPDYYYPHDIDREDYLKEKEPEVE